MQEISSKLPDVGQTIFTTMSMMANEYQALNLAQGFPNFPIDPKLAELLQISNQSLQHQYAHMQGSPVLIAEIVNQNVKAYGHKFEPKEILITAGATQALFTAIMALIQEGDEVILLDPCYDSYDSSIRLSGGKPVHVSLDQEFNVEWEALSSAVNENTKMLLINNPHNPSGRAWKRADMDTLINLCEQHPQLLILSDEVYEFIYFDDQFYSCKAEEKLRDRLICVSSFGKTFHITGWKMGYLTAPENLMKEILKVHQFNVFAVNHPAQVALAEYMKNYVNYDNIKDMYQAKRDLFQKALKESRWKILPCEGTFFQMLDYSEISQENDVEFAEHLTKEHGVAAIPTSVFCEGKFNQKILRFCFAKDDETLLKAAEKLCKI